MSEEDQILMELDPAGGSSGAEIDAASNTVEEESDWNWNHSVRGARSGASCSKLCPTKLYPNTY